MHRTSSIKWGLVIVMLILALSVCAACSAARLTPDGRLNYGTSALNNGRTNVGMDSSRVIEGYIVGYDSNNITIDEVELLTTSHSDRIRALGLNANTDFRDGYYVNNDGTRDRVTLPLASNVRVRFAEMATDGVRGGVNTGVGMDGYANGATYGTGLDGYGNAAYNTGINNNSATYGAGVNNYSSGGAVDYSGINAGVGVNNAGVGMNNAGVGVNNAGVNAPTTVPRTKDNMTGVGTTVSHLGHTMGGVAGGIVGGAEMITNRFNGGLVANDRTPYFITIENGYVTNIEEVRAYSNFAGMGRTTTHNVNNVNNTTNTTVR